MLPVLEPNLHPFLLSFLTMNEVSQGSEAQHGKAPSYEATEEKEALIESPSAVKGIVLTAICTLSLVIVVCSSQIHTVHS